MIDSPLVSILHYILFQRHDPLFFLSFFLFLLLLLLYIYIYFLLSSFICFLSLHLSFLKNSLFFSIFLVWNKALFFWSEPLPWHRSVFFFIQQIVSYQASSAVYRLWKFTNMCIISLFHFKQSVISILFKEIWHTFFWLVHRSLAHLLNIKLWFQQIIHFIPLFGKILLHHLSTPLWRWPRFLYRCDLNLL